MKPRVVVSLVLSGTLAIGGVGCAPIEREHKAAGKTAAARAPLVVVEREGQGSRLVLVDEHGRRVRTLTEQEGQGSLDAMPTLSPDGRFVAFASTRGRRSPTEFSLWVVPVDGSRGAAPLTDSRGTDITPAWSPDGKVVVFASTRSGAELDLWLVPIITDDKGHLGVGPPRRLTDSPAVSELDPSWSPSGGELVCTSVDGDVSSLAIVTFPGGIARRLTTGPLDKEPAWSPDGTTIAFSAQASGRADFDVLTVDANGANRRVLVDEANGDQRWPRWSRDGHWLFATSMFRDETGTALQSTLVLVDPRHPTAWRALVDRVPAGRLGIAATTPLALDDVALGEAPLYAAVLAKLLAP